MATNLRGVSGLWRRTAQIGWSFVFHLYDFVSRPGPYLRFYKGFLLSSVMGGSDMLSQVRYGLPFSWAFKVGVDARGSIKARDIGQVRGGTRANMDTPPLLKVHNFSWFFLFRNNLRGIAKAMRGGSSGQSTQVASFNDESYEMSTASSLDLYTFMVIHWVQ